jgi:N-acetyl-anhydromuramyl-L-alanine amidase AmpD
MAFTVEITFDDEDIDQLIAAYNETADLQNQICVEDFSEREDEIKSILREYMFDHAVDLLESENDEVFNLFAETFDPSDFDDIEEFMSAEEPPPRLN